MDSSDVERLAYAEKVSNQNIFLRRSGNGMSRAEVTGKSPGDPNRFSACRCHGRAEWRRWTYMGRRISMIDG